MKTVTIKYNPYLVSTQITIDGKSPKPNSALNVGRKRLQEWVEKLPQIILEEYRDSNVSIEFTGMTSDFEDVKTAFEAAESNVSASFKFHKTKDITDAEKTIDGIFKEIQNGPIPELKSPKISEAFRKAKDSRFEINVIATMSSGKSTLINALLGKQLMPAANEATTATIVKIEDADQDDFSAIAYDKSGHVVKDIKVVTLEDMKKLNNDVKVSTVVLKGKIPFVSSVGMKLVLVDTPGPNNSRDRSHQEMTYRMIADSDKSLVLYVMNGQQLGINDEKLFLDYICQKMQEGGKQSRERFIFAVNKMDSFKPKDEGLDCIEKALANVKRGLEDRGIKSPNIFPVSSIAALELRTDDDEPDELNAFRTRSKKYDIMHFDNYYQFSNLPQHVRADIQGIIDNAGYDEDVLVEVHSGIVSIEKAISLYINKYARVTKVCDLVAAFNEKLNELSAVARLEDAIRKDKNKKAELDKKIQEIKTNIQSAQNAQNRSKAIDNISLTKEIKTQVEGCINSANKKINTLLTGRSNKVEKSRAIQQCQELEKECKAISVQIKIKIEEILDKAYKETINKIIDEYKKYLSELNMGVKDDALAFNPANLVSGSLADLSSIITDNTETVDESYYETRTKRVFVESSRRWYNPFSWFDEGDHYENRSYQAKVAKYVDYVDMGEVSADYLIPFRKELSRIQTEATTHVDSETKRLKDYLKDELVQIDKILNEKLTVLSKTEVDNKAKASEIAMKEKTLKWLENIQKQINDIIVF